MWEIIWYTILGLLAYWLVIVAYLTIATIIWERRTGRPDHKFGSILTWRGFKFHLGLFAIIGPLLPIGFLIIYINKAHSWVKSKMRKENNE